MFKIWVYFQFKNIETREYTVSRGKGFSRRESFLFALLLEIYHQDEGISANPLTLSPGYMDVVLMSIFSNE